MSKLRFRADFLVVSLIILVILFLIRPDLTLSSWIRLTGSTNPNIGNQDSNQDRRRTEGRNSPHYNNENNGFLEPRTRSNIGPSFSQENNSERHKTLTTAHEIKSERRDNKLSAAQENNSERHKTLTTAHEIKSERRDNKLSISQENNSERDKTLITAHEIKSERRDNKLSAAQENNSERHKTLTTAHEIKSERRDNTLSTAHGIDRNYTLSTVHDIKSEGNKTLSTSHEIGSDQRDDTLSTAYVNRHLRYGQWNISSSLAHSTTEYRDILWWNAPNWMTDARWNENCNLSLCEYSNCKVITDRHQLNRSSAVIISIVDGGAEQVPVPRSKRNPNQPWVFYTLESPMSFWNQRFGNEEWRNVFNWSMTYRRDADISIPYGWLGKRQVLPNRNYSDIFRKKTKQAIWIVSHCSTYSKRENYIKRLQEYIDVDIYGQCGTRIEDSNFDETISKYKFYLGFENALCKDYITEKFFQYYKQDLIVVVRGSEDYGNLLPNNTFINTADYPTIKSLGQHLSKLANNEEDYIKYLKGKDRYTVLERWDTYCDGICNICEKVNNINSNRRTYGNIFDWTGGCSNPTDLH